MPLFRSLTFQSRDWQCALTRLWKVKLRKSDECPRHSRPGTLGDGRSLGAPQGREHSLRKTESQAISQIGAYSSPLTKLHNVSCLRSLKIRNPVSWNDQLDASRSPGGLLNKA
ncbi:MAG: hypothetical protein ACI8T1_001714 [Verrucomicrobiales bacterium]|jgi:hypothetical protein